MNMYLKQCYARHSWVSSSESDSDCSGKTSDFDEKYKLLKPGPIRYSDIKDNIVVIKAENDNVSENKPKMSYAHVAKINNPKAVVENSTVLQVVKKKKRKRYKKPQKEKSIDDDSDDVCKNENLTENDKIPAVKKAKKRRRKHNKNKQEESSRNISIVNELTAEIETNQSNNLTTKQKKKKKHGKMEGTLSHSNDEGAARKTKHGAIHLNSVIDNGNNSNKIVLFNQQKLIHGLRNTSQMPKDLHHSKQNPKTMLVEQEVINVSILKPNIISNGNNQVVFTQEDSKACFYYTFVGNNFQHFMNFRSTYLSGSLNENGSSQTQEILSITQKPVNCGLINVSKISGDQNFALKKSTQHFNEMAIFQHDICSLKNAAGIVSKKLNVTMKSAKVMMGRLNTPKIFPSHACKKQTVQILHLPSTSSLSVCSQQVNRGSTIVCTGLENKRFSKKTSQNASMKAETAVNISSQHGNIAHHYNKGFTDISINSRGKNLIQIRGNFVEKIAYVKFMNESTKTIEKRKRSATGLTYIKDDSTLNIYSQHEGKNFQHYMAFRDIYLNKDVSALSCGAMDKAESSKDIVPKKTCMDVKKENIFTSSFISIKDEPALNFYSLYQGKNFEHYMAFRDIYFNKDLSIFLCDKKMTQVDDGKTDAANYTCSRLNESTMNAELAISNEDIMSTKPAIHNMYNTCEIINFRRFLQLHDDDRYVNVDVETLKEFFYNPSHLRALLI